MLTSGHAMCGSWTETEHASNRVSQRALARSARRQGCVLAWVGGARWAPAYFRLEVGEDGGEIERGELAQSRPVHRGQLGPLHVRKADLEQELQVGQVGLREGELGPLQVGEAQLQQGG